MLIHEFSQPLVVPEGVYRVQVFGQPVGDIWSGWLVFQSELGAGEVLATDQETTQPNRQALEYWATGLEPVYLEGALVRAQDFRARSLA